MIATYTKSSKELDKFFDLSEKSLSDFDITAYREGSNKAINIRIEYKGTELFKMNMVISGSRKRSGSIQFDATAGNRVIHSGTVHASGQKERDTDIQSKIDEISDDWDKTVDYIKDRGWVDDENRIIGVDDGVLATAFDNIISGESPESAFKRYESSIEKRVASLSQGSDPDVKDFIDRRSAIKTQAKTEKDSIANLKAVKTQNVGQDLKTASTKFANQTDKLKEVLDNLKSIAKDYPEYGPANDKLVKYTALAKKHESLKKELDKITREVAAMDSLDRSDYDDKRDEVISLKDQADAILNDANEVIRKGSINKFRREAEKDSRVPNALPGTSRPAAKKKAVERQIGHVAVRAERDTSVFLCNGLFP